MLAQSVRSGVGGGHHRCPNGMCCTIRFGALPRGGWGGTVAGWVEAAPMIPRRRPPPPPGGGGRGSFVGAPPVWRIVWGFRGG